MYKVPFNHINSFANKIPLRNKILYLFIFIILGIIITIIIITVVKTVSKVCNEDVIITILPQGSLQGYERLNNNGETYYAYRSIPYAEPPIGALRFMPPVPHNGWSDSILNATKDVPNCQGENNVTGHEDCLYLNVYTKKKFLAGSVKPVIIFFHGGAFVTGSAREELYNPDFLMIKDIVFVTANYRLGLLGFLTLGKNVTQITANAGMKDQTLVLQWVQKNIQSFGGNSNSVTIMGSSAGGCSVNLHMFSPLSRGLFHRIIAQSGTALLPWCIGKYGSGEALSKVLNITNAHSGEILERLQRTDVSDIINFGDAVIQKFGVNVARYGSPVVENDVKGAFLPVHPSVLLSSGNYTNVPIIIGYNDKEGLIIHLLSKLGWEYTDLYDLTNLVPYNLNLNSKEVQAVVKEMEDFFFQGRQPVVGDSKILVDVITDTWFLYGVVSAAEKLSQFSNSVYLYRFSADTDLNLYKHFTTFTDYKGACHGDEVGYLFKTSSTPKIKKNSVEEVKMNEMVLLWTNFATYSDPTPSNTFGDFKWSPVSHSSPDNTFLYVENINLHEDVNPDNDRVQFWKYIYSKYGKLQENNYGN